MQEYCPSKCLEAYHPDDTPYLYLSKYVVEQILSDLNRLAASEKDYDTIAFIRFHENTQRRVAEGRMTSAEQKLLVQEKAEAFKQKHGDWVHHVNPLYWRFYDGVKTI